MLVGAFSASGLPEFLRGSWSNANKIADKKGVGPFPDDDNRRIVVSLSQQPPQKVIIAGKKLTCLDCPRYTECGICAHTLAVAHSLGSLEEYVDAYELPFDKMVASTIPCGSGRKENERRNVRKRTAKPPRDVLQYGERVLSTSQPDDEAEAPCEVVFVSSTRATTCYGCKGRIRNKASDPPPPPPYDVFLRHLERRVYSGRGEIKIRVSAVPEHVYYHPMRSCAANASRDNMNIEDAVKAKLAAPDKQLLWRVWRTSVKLWADC